MATFAPVTPQVTNTTAATFIPEIWSDEIIVAYEQNLVLANLIKKMSMKGKKGDTIHVPTPVRGTASKKLSQTAVAVQAPVTEELLINVDQHWEYSVMIEDITGVQALSSLRRFYTEDAGYAMAKNLDTVLFDLGIALGGTIAIDANPATPANWSGTRSFQPLVTTGSLRAFDSTGAVDPSTFTDASLRDGLQELDDNDVPMSGRFFVIPPSLVNTIRGVTQFSSSDFVNFKQTSTGEIGNLYGVPIFVSTNVPSIAVAGGPVRASLLGHKDAYVCAEQIGVRTQTQYKQEFLSTLMTADRLYGRQVYRPENAINIMTLA